MNPTFAKEPTAEGEVMWDQGKLIVRQTPTPKGAEEQPKEPGAEQ